MDPLDGGYGSRKLIYAAVTSVLIFSGGLIAGKWDQFGPFYGDMIAGLLGALSIYCGVNVSTKWVASKHAIAMAAAGPADDADKEVPAKDPAKPAPQETEGELC